jgi:predicted transcriptional regulator
MSRKKNNKTLALERQRQAFDLRCKGWTDSRIAQHLGVSRQAVSKMLRRVDERALQKLGDKARRMMLQLTAQLEHLLDEAIQAWERSKENSKSMTKRSFVPREGEKPTAAGEAGAADKEGEAKAQPPAGVEIPLDQVTMHQESSCGDTIYLDKAMEAIAQLRRVWGVDASNSEEEGKGGPGQTPAAKLDVTLNLAPYDAVVQQFLAAHANGPPGQRPGLEVARGGVASTDAAPQAAELPPP